MPQDSGFTRRKLLQAMASSSFLAALGANLTACSNDGDSDSTFDPIPSAATVEFKHGVASGDPLADRVIIWTRATPSTEGRVDLQWEIASDADFGDIVNSGTVFTDADRDYTAKADVNSLDAGTDYYYRFRYSGSPSAVESPVGQTRTLGVGAIAEVSLAVVSCSNYPAGFFNVYREAADGNYDAVLHLGDYIYEYAAGGFATQDAEALGRVPDPIGEIVNLEDYRTRYAQYRSDTDLQALHARFPFILVWDDHEVANNTWREGAENHDPDSEGDFAERKMHAIQAYYEWLPIRPPQDLEKLYRHFQFGDLVDLLMLDTRVVGRDQQLDVNDFATDQILDAAALNAAVSDTSRTMLGTEQKAWLLDKLTTATATWQVFGQQVLMFRGLLPTAIVEAAFVTGDSNAAFALGLQAQAALAKDPADRTAEEQALLASRVPWMLDPWDGYAAERDEILAAAQQLQRKLVVLAGDSHNAWASQLTTANGEIAGVEFATPGVSSPGIDGPPPGLNLADEATATAAEGVLLELFEELQYLNAFNRGYMNVTFTPAEVRSEWIFVDTVKSQDYQISASRGKVMRADVDTLLLEDA
ncbi:MAG: alkaline phosphatase D family protein [Pseudomonadales bacterium]